MNWPLCRLLRLLDDLMDVIRSLVMCLIPVGDSLRCQRWDDVPWSDGESHALLNVEEVALMP